MTDPCEASDYFPLVAAKAGGALHDKCLFGIHDVTNRCDEIDVGRMELYTEIMPNIFVVEHRITNSVNVTTRRGKMGNFVDMQHLRTGMDAVK